MHREEGKVPVPLFAADRIDLTVEWRALLHGALVGEMELFRPTLELVAGQTPSPGRLPEEMDWAQRLVGLYPFEFDRVAVHEGQIHFRAPHREPPVDVALHDVRIETRNLTNSRDLSAARPARVTLDARVQRSGRVTIELEIDPLAARPDFRLELEVASIQLAELNDFLRAYVGVDAQRGRFDLTSRVVSEDGRFDGYVEPLLRGVDLLKLDEEAEKQGLLATLWEAAVGGAAEVLENQPEDQLAARVPLHGSFEKPKLGVWGALVSLFENGYVEALRPSVELLRERARRERLGLSGQARGAREAGRSMPSLCRRARSVLGWSPSTSAGAARAVDLPMRALEHLLHGLVGELGVGALPARIPGGREPRLHRGHERVHRHTGERRREDLLEIAEGLAALRRLRAAGVVLCSVPPRIALEIDDERG